VTVNIYRPGGVDTAMQAWIRSQDHERIGPLRERFNRNFAAGTPITPGQSAAALLAHMVGDGTGARSRQREPVAELVRRRVGAGMPTAVIAYAGPAFAPGPDPGTLQSATASVSSAAER
jgi:hypothetical protein